MPEIKKRETSDGIIITNVSYVHYQKATKSWKYSKINTSHSVSFVISGSCYASCNENNYILHKGDILYQKKGDIYSSSDKTLPFEYIMVEFDYLGEPKESLQLPEFHEVINFDRMHMIFKELYEVHQTSSPTTELKLKRIMYDFFILFINETLRHKENYNYKKIEASVKYLNENIFKRYIDVIELAELSDLSLSHFNRLFKSVYNLTPTKYMNELRIERGKKLLTESTLQVSQIAEMCGFSSTYYFSKMFKQITGTSPLRFRTHSD